jgi:hypothetical protein
MLLLNAQKILIFTPNKCASTSLNETLTGKMNAQMILGPQGPWRQHGFDYDDCIGKHSMFVPFWCQNWEKWLIVRDPYDRFISLWKHYCRYHEHDVDLEHFIGIVTQYKMNPPKGWFYTQRMRDFIDQSPQGTRIVDVKDLNILAQRLGLESFPKLHTTEHEDYKSYYTPELYRRVYDLV